VYSLGCVLFECLAGRPPFTADREELVLRMHLDHEAPEVRSLRPDTPEPLAITIDRALRGPREARWQTVEEMQRALDAHEAGPSGA